ncbi:MarR family winged helix-turn-helix transcriptional regulator [Candidimonas humi]|uniref:MarR family winged helix-turn-helix transcriptional regulator n=1 Tax=Candidimonas humi TaxID=683355 RepID=A0ABV8NVY0_9BURK|nr:MarR family winged helix-turn-helix transcriptional regulator [Candidimonas humi]MBV6305192.1 MarR family winged helix-turn-helix transcriptional regulator [Candidimonas humi]
MNSTQGKTNTGTQARGALASEPGRDLDGWLPYSFSVLANRVSSCLFDMYSQQYGLSVPGWRIMAVLGIHQPLSAKEVAQYTAMDQVSVSRAINQMAKLGLITRRVDKADRRKVALTLNSKGEAARAEIVPIALALERAIVKALTEQERVALGSMMEKLMVASQSELPSPENWRSAVKKFGALSAPRKQELGTTSPA